MIGNARPLPVVADHVEVREPELVGGELRQHLDAQGVQPVEERPGLGVEVGGQVEHHAPVQRPEQQAVAVPLEAFEQAVPHRPVHVRPGPEPVGDEGGEGLVAVRQLEVVERAHIHRHPHPVPVAGPDRLDPGERGVPVHRGARGKAEREGVGHVVAAEVAHEVVVGAHALRLVEEPKRRADHLGDLRHRTDDRLPVRRPVAVTRGMAPGSCEGSSRNRATFQAGTPVRSKGASGNAT
jgi:hypothetical protein